MELDYYRLNEERNILSPSLIYYLDAIKNNINHAIQIAGNAQRLWPHVKSHKTKEMVKLQIEMGIQRFKCATISEAEMVASCNAPHVLISYPLIGPNIERYIDLKKRYSNTEFWAIGDNLEQIKLLGEALLANKMSTKFLIDVNMGMNRTGVPFNELEEFTIETSKVSGVNLDGFHCYDGHLGITDVQERQRRVHAEMDTLYKILGNLKLFIEESPVLIMGGSPTFPCHAKYKNVYLSPGTIFINDNGYSSNFPDLNFPPAAAILSRVISHPSKDFFTLDLGYKGIASDPSTNRGRIVGYPNAKPVLHSEEHWVFEISKDELPPVGTVVYVIPTHICPTSALYPNILVAEKGNLVNTWTVDARNRKINI